MSETSHTPPQLNCFTYLLWAAAIFAAGVCLNIEYLNYRAGGVLPRDVGSIKQRGGNPKWRLASPRMAYDIVLRQTRQRPLTNEERTDPSLITLTADESRLLSEYQDEIELDNRLHRRVSTFGCLQYPLCVVGIFLAAMLLKWNDGESRLVKNSAFSTGTIFVLCLLDAFYRSYFSSLGF